MNTRALFDPLPDADASPPRDRPVAILIAALGGEGGGVLTQWLVEAALDAGYPVQSTSIPGVAQRTGATTYYVEIHPEPVAALGMSRPVLNLAPVAGRVDLLVASELLEAVRVAQAGFVDRVRTTVVASTSRAYTNREKIAMGDGREDAARLVDVLAANSRRHVGFDMNAEAREARTVISAVMFGAVAGSGLLPFGRAHCEAAIRASGKGVDASLDGFARGFARMRVAGAVDASDARPATGPDADPAWPESARAIVDAGVRRLVDYQDEAYARLFLDRVATIRALETRIDPTGAHGHALARETARFLALWMAFDDLARVADLKTRPERYARIRTESAAGAGDLVAVHDYFKPRVDELAGALPPVWSRRVLAWSERRRRAGKAPLAFPLLVRSDGRVGRALLKTIAAARRFRRASARYADEDAAIRTWLEAIRRTASLGWEPAFAIALCGRLVKGYGDTHARGHENLGRILATLGSDEAVARAAGDGPALAVAVDAAREAALADPDGKVLDREIARHGAAPRPVVAKPLVFVRPKRAA